MKQKVVIKVQMDSDKCRTKAMKIAATTVGVCSVAIDGADRSKLVVKGDEIDTVGLVMLLRKSVGRASILSVEIREVSITGKKPEEREDNPTPSYSPVYGCK